MSVASKIGARRLQAGELEDRRDRRVAAGFLATLLVAGALLGAALGLPEPAGADPFPPYWDGPSTSHFELGHWPANDGDGRDDYGDWIPYGQLGMELTDQRDIDPSHGGARPQNYVNVSSGCTDLTYPSVFIAYDPVARVFFYRWRVEQIAHNYATGPSPGAFSSGHPWKSALWTVFIDITGNGYRDFAYHIDGSSGVPAFPIDRINAIYSATASHSIDYVNDPEIHHIAHESTAFIERSNDRILNFQNSLTPTSSWPNGASETVWDFGPTRARRITHPEGCTEYFVDYQIPLDMLDASAVGGPVFNETTPFRMLYATANSLQNPLQKDVVYDGDYCTDLTRAAPFGDTTVIGEDGQLRVVREPVVLTLDSTSCPTSLRMTVMDALISQGCGQDMIDTVYSVEFYLYHDVNGDGIANDGGSWFGPGPTPGTFSPFPADGFTATRVPGTLHDWQADVDTTVLPQGQFLVGVKAVDLEPVGDCPNGLHDCVLEPWNTTWSFLTEAELAAEFGTQDPGYPQDGNYPNPTGLITTTFINTCGTAPSVTKSASVSEVAAGGFVDFTITVAADTLNTLQVDAIHDTLPPGWTYVENVGGSLTPTSSPTGGATGTVTWTFSPAAEIPPGTSADLVFRAQAPLATGSYTNVAQAVTNQGTFEGSAEVGVGAPRLTILKDADPQAAEPGDFVTFTITYSNDSPLNVTNVVITDQLPQGLIFVSATGGGTYDPATNTVTWDVGLLGSGDGPFTVSFQAQLEDPYPSGAPVPLVNTAVIDSDQTDPASASASVFINLPLAVQKRSTSIQVAPGGTVTYIIDFANAGAVDVTNGYIVDQIPPGFTFQSATCADPVLPGCVAPGSAPGGVATWSLGTVPAGYLGSVTLTLQATDPYTGASPAVNTATFGGDDVTEVEDSHDLGITQSACTDNTLYFRNQTTNVGAAGVQRVATGPPAPTETATAVQLLGVGSAFQELARFYQEPATTTAASISGIVTTQLYINKTGSPQAVFEVQLFTYDPGTGATTSLGAWEQNVTGNRTNHLITVTSPSLNAVLPEGHRLLWVVRVRTNHASNTNDLALNFDGSASPSNSAVCLAPFSQVLDKWVDPILATPGDTLTYTLPFGNSSLADSTGAHIIDTLPAGVTFVGARLNCPGDSCVDPATPLTIDGRTYHFQVNTPGAAAGTLAAGATGALEITVAIDNPPTTSDLVLTNEATLTSNQVGPVHASASTTVTRPALELVKRASDTFIQVGETAVYTLTITNLGNATSTNIDLEDLLPEELWYEYNDDCAGNSGSTGATVVCDDADAPTLSITVDALAPGQSVTVTYSMTATLVPGEGPPDGTSDYPNTVTGDDDFLRTSDGTVSSNEVIVTISTNPNLQLTKGSTPAPPQTVEAGGVVTYTLTLANTGSSAATSVAVSDPIPDFTSYVAGSMTFDGSPQTDAADGDAGRFEAVANRVVFDIGTLGSGVSHEMTFQVQVANQLPAGTTPIVNTATATASNAASRQATATVDAEAEPVIDLLKSAPESLAFPLTTLAVGTGGASTVITVVDSVLLEIGDTIAVNGQARRIVDIGGIDGNTVTLDGTVTGAADDEVHPTIRYILRYTNNGTATATDAVITDTLPTGTTFVSATGGGVHSGGVVTWSLGDVPPGMSATVSFIVLPGATGVYLNDFDFESPETGTVTSNEVETSVGTLRPWKVTEVPHVVNSGDGQAETIYAITVTNDSGTTATGVEVYDEMETGFFYKDELTIEIDGSPAPPSGPLPSFGDHQATWCCWTLAPGETLEIRFVAGIAANVPDGVYQNAIVVSSDNVAALPFDELATEDEDVTVEWAGDPDHLFVASFEAELDGGDVVVTWTTGVQIGTAGFRVYRDEPGRGLVPVGSGEVLPSLAGAFAGGTYRLVDRDGVAGPARYYLVEIEAGGAELTYGPFEVDPVARESTRGAAVRRGGERLAPGFTAQDHAAGPRPATRGQTRKGPAAGTPGDALRIAIREPGLYHIDSGSIESALGLRPGGARSLLQSGRLRLTSEGHEVAWAAEPKNQPTGLLFYAEGIRSLWTAERIYRLEEARGTTVAEVAAAPQSTATGLESFRDTVRLEKDESPFTGFPIPEGEEFWLWSSLRGGHASQGRRSFAIEAPGTVADGTARLSVRLQGLSATGEGQHRVEVRFNGTLLGEARFRGFGNGVFHFDLDGSLVAESNEIELLALREPGVSTSLLALDWFELDYWRDYVADQPSFAFGGGGNQDLVVFGFSEPGIEIYEVTDPRHPRRLSGVRVEPDAFGTFRAHFAPPTPQGAYLALVPQGRQAPAATRASRHAGLLSTSNWADYLVITHYQLMEAAEALAHLRHQQGLVTLVVDIDDIMDELTGGIFDPEALKAFLSYAYHEWQQPPRYVVLAGSGTFDYRDAFGLGTNLLPPLLARAHWGFYPADNRLADVVGGDGVPEMAIGRVPAETPEQLFAYVEKVAAFEAAADAAWMQEVVMLADRPAATGDYTTASHALATRLPAGAVPHHLDFGPMTRPQVRSELMALLQQGVSLVNYVGHASPGQLGSQALLGFGDIPGLTNAERLPIFSVISCHVGQFALPGIPALAQRLVLHPHGGAVAAWSPTTLSFHPNRTTLGAAFLDALRDPSVERVGDAVQRALATPAARETRDTQVLLGDPALLLRVAPMP